MPTDPLDTAATLRAEYEVGREERVPWNVYGFIERLLAALEAAERDRDAAQFIMRYGSPFDPTGAKSGVEIRSLREKVARLRAALEECKRQMIAAAASEYTGGDDYHEAINGAAAVLTDTEPQQ